MKLNVSYIVREFVSVCVFVRANGTHSFPIKKDTTKLTNHRTAWR